MKYLSAVRKVQRVVAGVALTIIVQVGICAYAHGDDAEPQVATATAQDLLEPIRGLSVVWHGKLLSALPFRIRLLNQASPLAYSLDIRRSVAYGDSWTGISLGRPSHEEDRSLSSVGVANPLIAEAIARGDVSADEPASQPSNYTELAARQIAIWSVTNDLPLTSQAIPDARVRRRAQQLVAGASQIQVPLQAAYHSVQIFVRETTANTVKLAVTISLDANTHSTTPQDVDLYLDGVRCPVRTQAATHIRKSSDGTYTADKPTALTPKTHSTDIAEVELDRNTKVVDATATWVNVISDPGLVMVSDGTAPPLLTAEAAALNFTSTAKLDPANYTNPEELLNNFGTAILTGLPGWTVWVVLILALYLVPRIGRTVDSTLGAAYRSLRPKHAPAEPVVVTPSAVSVEARTEADAVRTGLLALNLTSPSEADITVVQPAQHHLVGPDDPAVVRLTRRPGSGSDHLNDGMTDA
jgi:hypothetical protein